MEVMDSTSSTLLAPATSLLASVIWQHLAGAEEEGKMFYLKGRAIITFNMMDPDIREHRLRHQQLISGYYFCHRL